jgi:uncharacterized protein (DUF58 family)
LNRLKLVKFTVKKVTLPACHEIMELLAEPRFQETFFLPVRSFSPQTVRLMTDLDKTRPSWSISLPGLLSLMAGCGQLLAYWKFHEYTRNWPDALRFTNYAVAFCLTLWGVLQLVADWQKKSASRTSRAALKNGLPSTSSKPRRSQRLQYRVNIPVEGIIFLFIMIVLFVGSMLGRENMLLLVFSLLAGAFVTNGFISFNMLRKLSVKRQIPSLVTAGEPTNIYLEITNRKRMAVWVLTVSDMIANDRETLRASIVFTRIRGKGRQIGQYRIQLMQRGRYSLGPVQFSTRFPLGIVERSAIAQENEELIVCPRPGQLLVSRKDLRSHDQLVMRQSSRVGTYDDEFHRIREYRTGDNTRRIHWRSTARRNELMVKEFHETRDENLMVLLDLWQPPSPNTSQLEGVETAVSFATTLIKDHLTAVRDSDIQLAATGAENDQWMGQAGAGGWESILRFLALVQAGPQSDLTPLKDFWNEQRKPDTRSLLITTRTLPELVDLLQSHKESEANDRSSFELDLLIYSTAEGGLDGLFEPPENLIRYEDVPQSGHYRLPASSSVPAAR